MTIPSLLAVAVLVLAIPLNWFVTWRLWLLARGSDNWALRAHAVVAFTLAILVTIFGLVFLNNDQAVPPLNPETTRIITRATVLALSIPGLYWLYLVRKA